MIQNEHGFNVLATTKDPIDVVIRFGETAKADFLGVPFIETKLTDHYGYQLILGAYSREGEYPLKESIMKLLEPGYRIGRTRIEIAVPSALTLRFLLDLQRNVHEAIRKVREWERMRLIK